MQNKYKLGLIGLILSAGLAYWGYKAYKTGEAEQKPTGAPEVTVSLAKALQKDVPIIIETNGLVVSMNTVEVRTQVANVIKTIHIKEGQLVNKGDLIATLDDRNDRANLAKVKAQLARDQASLADAERQYKRSKELFEQKFISQSALDTALTQVEAQRATVQADTAAVQAAEVALGYNTLRAPLSGKAGIIPLFPGSYLKPDGTPVTTISQINPIAVSFTVPEAELPGLLEAQRTGQQSIAVQPTTVNTPIIGKLSFVDNNVDATTGTLRAKGELQNPHQALWPGQYAAVRLTLRTLRDAIVIPQAAIVNNATDRLVYVVNAENQVTPRKVKVLYSNGNDAVVTNLQANEQVVVDGKQNLRPGSKVREAKAMPAKASGAISASASATRAAAPASIATATHVGNSAASSRP